MTADRRPLVDDETRSPNQPILAEALLDDDGNLPCDPPDDCSVCVLFTDRRPGESRTVWLARLRDVALGIAVRAGAPPVAVLAAAEAVEPIRKRWSVSYDQCRDPECETPYAPHNGHGYCRTCYYRRYRVDGKEAVNA